MGLPKLAAPIFLKNLFKELNLFKGPELCGSEGTD